MTKDSKLIFAASEGCADMWYVTGFCAPDPFLWFSVDGAGYMVVYGMEVPRARQQCRTGITVIPWGDLRNFCGQSEGPVPNVRDAIKLISDKFGISSWQVPYDFPLGIAAAIKAANYEISFEPIGDFCPERRVKSRDEIEKIRHSQQLAEAGLAKALAILEESKIDGAGLVRWRGEVLLAEQLRGEIDAEIARLGGCAFGTIAAPGIQGADPHLVGNGPIKAGDPIVLDIFPRCNDTGYYGDLTRTVVKGQATPVVKRAYQTVYEAQQLALSMMKAGIEGHTVHEAVEAHFKASGYETSAKDGISQGFFHGLGHSVGLEIHEGPHMNKKQGEFLEAGNVITVEPGLYYRDWGGIRLENTVAVTDDGILDLTTAEYRLEIP